MADEVASLLVRITADGSQATGVLNGISATVGTLADKNATMMNKLSATGAIAGKIGQTITKTVGVATVAGLTAAAKAAGQLNKELANIGTLSVPTERLKEFKGQIQDIAIATGKGTSDISEGTYQVISAFGDAADTMEKVEINAKAARAGIATTADSINLTSAVTKAYGDTSAAAVQHVADLAFKTVELGQTTFPELAQSMQQVTSLSKELGVSQEELFASYATLTGVTGNAAEVQTQIKAIYTALLKPSDNMTKAIKKQGYESGYAMIKAKGFAGTLETLKEATGGSEEKMLGLFNNVRAMPAVMALTGAQADTFMTKLQKMEQASGAATKAFEVQTEGVAKTGFTLEQAKVKMQVAAQKFGESAAPLIGDFADMVDKASTALANMSDEQRKSLIDGALTVTKWGVGLSVGGKLLTLGTQFVGVTKAVGTAIAAIPGPAKLAVAGIAALGIGVAAAVEGYQQYQYEQTHFADGAAEAAEALKKQKSALDEVNNYTWEFKELQFKLNSNDISEEEKNRIISRMQEIAKWFKENYEVELKVESGSVEVAAENVDKLNRKLKHVQIDTEIQGNNTLSELIDGYEAFKNAPGDRDWNTEQADKWEAEAEKMLNAKMRVSDIASQVSLILSDTVKSEGEKNAALKKEEVEYQKLLKELYPNGGNEYNNLLSGFSHITDINPFDKRYEQAAKQAKIHTANAELAQEQMEKFVQTTKDYISQQNEMLSYDIGNGDDYSERLKKIGYAAQMAEIPLGEVAAQTASAQNGFKTFADAAAQGGTALDNTIANAIQNMQSWGASTDEIVRTSALMKNGFTDLQGAIQAGALDAVIKDFITQGHNLGLTTNQIVTNAALLKNGFTDIDSAVKSGDISGLINDLGRLGGNMGMSLEQVSALAKELNLIPKDKTITINAEGNYEIVDDLNIKLKEFNSENVHVSVDAEGDISILNQADGAVKNLKLDGAVALQVNSEGNIDVLDQAGKKLAEIKNDPSATVTVNSDIQPAASKTEELNDTPVEVKVTADTSAADTKIKELEQTVPVTVSVTYTATNSVPSPKLQAGPSPQAKGTQNFAGGLAMVNDDGSSDPRELIVDKGRAFIPEGKNVILPLSKGAKVYTAAQTKAIMSGMGIPHYAEGKNNSDAFTAAKDDWTHYTKTHAVTTAQELQKWLELQKQFKDNEKDIWDIEEQIFSLQQKITQEINNQSKAYIEERASLNDWEEVGDSPLEAFGRIKDRNYQDLQDAKITWEDYVKNVSDAGETLYDGMLKQSDNWLEHQRKYHNMSIDEYIAGIDREEARLEEFYANDAINHQKYIEEYQALEEKRFDAIAEKNADEYAAWQKDADAWQELRSTYGDWDKYGDSEEDFLKRKIDRVKKFYEIGKISFEEFIDDTNRYSMDLYKAQEGYVDDLLQKQSDYISDLREQFSEQEQALRDSWTVADRKTDMADVSAQLDIYNGAVTDRGQQKYKELQEQMKQLQRDEELYQLQVANNATIESLEAEYKQMEEGKANILEGLRTANINISAYVDSISKSLSQTGVRVESLLGQLLQKFDSFKVESNSMTDNRQIINNISQMRPEQLQEFVNSIVGY